MKTTPLKRYRKLLGMSQVQLAEESGVSRSTINRIESGTFRPRVETARKLAKALGITLDELLK